MVVSSTDIQNDFNKYLDMAADQEILITKDGDTIARLIGMKIKMKSISEQLRGIIPANIDEKAIKDERMSRR